MANDRIYLRCKGCGELLLLAKFWGGGEIGPIFQSLGKAPPGGDIAPGDERLDAAHEWLTKHLCECREGFGMGLDEDPGFTVVVEGNLQERLFLCPTCAAPASNLGPGYDPFAPDLEHDLFPPQKQLAVQMSCANGHTWIESQRYGRDGKPEGPRQQDPVEVKR